MRRRLPALLGLLLLALALVAGACGDDEQDREASAQPQGDELVLTLGMKDFTEAFIVGELYRQALRSQSINVKLRKDIGPTEVIDNELQSGAIDAYPEYLGVAVTVAAGRDDAGGTAEQTYALAKEFYAGRGQAISEQTAFENVAANVFTTDGQLASGSYKVLEDTERVFGFQHVALVIDEEKLQELGGSKFMRIINDVNERLTTSAMIQMNRDVELDGQGPATVAERFLRTAGLLGGGD